MTLDITQGSIDEADLSGDRLQIIHLSLDWVIENRKKLPWLKNAKKHDIGGIWESITKYGFQDSAKWDRSLNGGNGGIVYGNGRHECLLSILIEARQKGELPPKGIPISVNGDWAIPITVGVDQDSEAMAIALGIDHNNLTYSASDTGLTEMTAMWRQDELIALLSEIADENVMPVTMDEDALASLILGLEQAGGSIEEDEEDLEKLLEESEGDGYEGRVKPGEVWQLGRHFIACGDCCDEGNIAELRRAAGVEKIDMVWADPPYGISIVATNGYVGGGEASNIPFGGVKNETSEQKSKRMGYVGGGNCRRTTIAENAAKKQGLGTTNGSKPSGRASNVVKVNKYYSIAGDDSIHTAINSTDQYLRLFGDAIHCWWGGNYFAHVLPPSNCWIVWDKENTGDFADAELAWTNQSSAVRIFKHMWNGMVKASEHGQKRVHPTQKPIALATWFFEKYGQSCDTIIDPFLGSGMSIIAAEQLGDRTVIGFELSEKYCSIICDRWEQITGGTAEKVGDLSN